MKTTNTPETLLTTDTRKVDGQVDMQEIARQIDGVHGIRQLAVRHVLAVGEAKASSAPSRRSASRRLSIARCRNMPPRYSLRALPTTSRSRGAIPGPAMSFWTSFLTLMQSSFVPAFAVTFLMAASVAGQPVAVAEDVTLKQGYGLSRTVGVVAPGMRDIRLTVTWDTPDADVTLTVDPDGYDTVPPHSTNMTLYGGRADYVMSARFGAVLKVRVSNPWGPQLVFSLHTEDIGPAVEAIESEADWGLQVNRSLYNEMVYAGLDDGYGPYDVSYVLGNPAPRFYIRTREPGDTEECTTLYRVYPDEVRLWQAIIPVVIEQLTGRPYRHPVEAGCADRGEREGWVTVTYTWPSEYKDETGDDWGVGNAARARVGWDAGRIWIGVEEGYASVLDLQDTRSRASLMAHEIGHAMGFWHTSHSRRSDGRKHVMAPGRTEGWFFTPDEVAAARAAYAAGRYVSRNKCPRGGVQCRSAEGSPRFGSRRPIIIAN